MVLVELTNDNYYSMLEKLFEKSEPNTPIIVMYGSESCRDCKKTHKNIHEFLIEMESNQKSLFCYVNMHKCWIPEEKYPEFYKMNSYPKTVVYKNNIDSTTFYEGELTVEIMKEIENS